MNKEHFIKFAHEMLNVLQYDSHAKQKTRAPSPSPAPGRTSLLKSTVSDVETRLVTPDYHLFKVPEKHLHLLVAFRIEFTLYKTSEVLYAIHARTKTPKLRQMSYVRAAAVRDRS